MLIRTKRTSPQSHDPPFGRHVSLFAHCRPSRPVSRGTGINRRIILDCFFLSCQVRTGKITSRKSKLFFSHFRKFSVILRKNGRNTAACLTLCIKSTAPVQFQPDRFPSKMCRTQGRKYSSVPSTPITMPASRTLHTPGTPPPGRPSARIGSAALSCASPPCRYQPLNRKKTADPKAAGLHSCRTEKRRPQALRSLLPSQSSLPVIRPFSSILDKFPGMEHG